MTYPKDYTISYSGTNTTGETFSSAGPGMSWTWVNGDDEDVHVGEILEDGPWSPLYEWEDYVGLMHAVLATELGLDEEDI